MQPESNDSPYQVFLRVAGLLGGLVLSVIGMVSLVLIPMDVYPDLRRVQPFGMYTVLFAFMLTAPWLVAIIAKSAERWIGHGRRTPGPALPRWDST